MNNTKIIKDIIEKYKIKKHLSEQCKSCKNNDTNCWRQEGEGTCIRYLPEEGTNLVEIDGIFEVPPNIDEDIICQMFTNWVDSLGWAFCGMVSPCKDEDDSNENM